MLTCSGDSSQRVTREIPVVTDVWGRPAGVAVLAREYFAENQRERCHQLAETAELPALDVLDDQPTRGAR